MSDHVLELVVFQLRPGVTREQALSASEAVSAWVAEQPGFVSRETYEVPDGEQWVDVLYWRSMAEAKAASERAMAQDHCQAFFSLLAPEAEVFLHAVPVPGAGVGAA